MTTTQRSTDEWWWCRDEALKSISRSLSECYMAIVDDFLPVHEVEGVCAEVTSAYSNGLLSLQGLTGGEGGVQSDEMVRGDLVGFFESRQGPQNDAQRKEGWSEGISLTRALEKMNTVVCEMRDSSDRQCVLPELKAVSTRSRAMVTCYPGQQRAYTKHCDNAVRNGRKLTAILYLNKHWTSQDGGELKIYPDYGNADDKVYRTKLSSVFGFDGRTCSAASRSLSIQPIVNRLVLFWSDMRCPHEVLPTHKPRFAVTLWFIDGKERNHTVAAAAAEAMSAATAATAHIDNKTGLNIKQGTGAGAANEKGNLENGRDFCSAQEPPASPGRQKETNQIDEAQLTVSPVTLLSDDNGEVVSWCAQEQCLLYQVHFSDPSLVPHTLVDVVNKGVLLIHTADNLFVPIEIPIHLPGICAQNSIQENKTTAKYNRRKSILSVRLFIKA